MSSVSSQFSWDKFDILMRKFSKETIKPAQPLPVINAEVTVEVNTPEIAKRLPFIIEALIPQKNRHTIEIEKIIIEEIFVTIVNTVVKHMKQT